MIKKILSPILQSITFIIALVVSFGATVIIVEFLTNQNIDILSFLILYALISACLFYGVNVLIFKKIESRQTNLVITHLRCSIVLYLVFILTKGWLVINGVWNSGLLGGYTLAMMEIALVGIITNAIFLYRFKK